MLSIASIKEHAQKAKECAQNILALGDPGNGFHMHWVQGEKGGNEGTAPNRTGQSAKQSE